ncbi:MAG: MMPL family transporter, partial [candidate division WOR-3 bacterium]|nr:MMPL family transporter [candidate division WOR-3 bacterium]
MQKFADLVIKYRMIIIVSVVALTGFFGYHLKNLEIDTDILRYLPKNDSVVILFNEVGDKFGGTALAMVALETDPKDAVHNVFNYETLNRVEEITERFKQMDEVSHVMSLTDIIDIKKTEWGLEVGKLIDKHNIPDSPGELEKLKEYTLSKDMYQGNVISEDGKITVIIARLEKDADKVKTAHKLKEIVKATKGNERIYYGGIPFQMASVLGFILGDLYRLIPLVTILVMVTLFFSFRTLQGVFLPLF